MAITMRYVRTTTAICAVLAVTACEVPEGPQAATPTQNIVDRAVEPTAQRDGATPRPDLFALRTLAAWDGRPSLGGAWIAHPDVVSAERASITEISTGRTITAALFRRDPSIPGPPFQLSADAAQQLGVTPGVPVEVEVVALRFDTTAPAPSTSQDVVADIAEPMQATIIDIPDTAPDIPANMPDVEPVAPVVAAPQPATVPPSPPAPGAVPERPYMQVGTFGVASNATALVTKLQAEGLSARTEPAGALTRVVVGPARSASDLAAIRDRLRQMGFDDALAVAL